MGWITIFTFGLMHGLQPDHLAAAGALAAKTGASVLGAALRIATGHALALLAFAAGALLLPHSLAIRLETWADGLAGVSLAVIGLAVLLQAIRGRYVVHAHEHTHDGETHAHVHVHHANALERHEHRHLKAAVAVGLVLGVGGARSLVVLLPRIAGTGSGLLAIAVYCAGIFLAVSGLATLADVLRKRMTGQNVVRLMDGAFGVGAMAAGVHLLVVGF